ncbi:glycerol acyltransferase [Bacteroidia bacterium]|nr:glycerol acyltransferase [Bacteroidia bacterium]
MDDKFESIRHYNDSEISEAMQRIADAPQLSALISLPFPNSKVEDIKAVIRTIKTADEFQQKICMPAFQSILRHTVSRFKTEGFGQLNRHTPYLFVANHRDIALDAIFLQVALLKKRIPTSAIGIGSNLIQTQFVMDLWRSNKAISVIRGGAMSEALNNSKLLSEYIHYSITQKEESVWIAQRNGRTKNGIDVTNPALIKMLTLNNQGALLSHIQELNIVPTVISYQIEPCDWMKVHELLQSQKEGSYTKAPNEDFQSIITGIMQKKGTVTLKVMNPLNKLLRNNPPSPDLNNNELCKYIANLIDSEINRGYTLYDSNYIAYDLLHQTSKYERYYTRVAKIRFIVDMNEKLAKIGHHNYEEMKAMFLSIYANPVEPQ